MSPLPVPRLVNPIFDRDDDKVSFTMSPAIHRGFQHQLVTAIHNEALAVSWTNSVERAFPMMRAHNTAGFTIWPHKGIINLNIFHQDRRSIVFDEFRSRSMTFILERHADRQSIDGNIATHGKVQDRFMVLIEVARAADRLEMPDRILADADGLHPDDVILQHEGIAQPIGDIHGDPWVLIGAADIEEE